MFRLPLIMFKMINVAYVFMLITSMYFLDGVADKGVLTLKPTRVDATLLTSKIGSNRTIIVDIHGSEDFMSVQDAIDSIPLGNPNWVIIHVKEGVYREKVRIPREKPRIFLKGSGRTKTSIVWSQSSENNYESSTFKVEAPYFVAYGISFKNDAPTGIANTSHNQSVAAYVGADKVAFYSCGFYSNHNTLLDNKGRHYYDGCYIQGSIDVIFGRARSIFHDCEILVIMDNRMEILGSVTAHSRTSTNENTGFVFIRGKIYGTGHAFLGRPKGDHSRVVFVNTYMSKSVRPEGWSKWNHNGNLENIYHAEYDCHGPGSATNNRAKWLKKLSDEEVAPFLSTDFIDGKKWLITDHVSTKNL
ncbi:Pectinesterase, active site-containing protein [Cynara cardunculus var. scolymus]|uniref:Pectinesterase n=1 Tax=Cynara cardunculus var. scolymus TaxID=59895 RepID=A0A103XZL5_CYNCS|nr:Pectinesterase, active site-containing protein [Cynara cardunculus var. scolymus]